MIKLKSKLQGDAEKKFQEMLDWSGTDKEKIVLDALDLLHHVMQEMRLGRMGGRPVQQNEKDIIRRENDAIWNIITRKMRYAPKQKK